MRLDRAYFLLMATLVAVGILLSTRLAIPFWADGLLLFASLLCLASFAMLRRGWWAFLPFCLFFILVGFLRAGLPDVSLLPDAVEGWGASLAHSLGVKLQHQGLRSDTSALLQAMLLGQRKALRPDIVDLYRQSGASHILALSGLHLSVLFGLFELWLVHVLRNRLRYPLCFLGLLMLWGYALLTGFPLSLCRASVMMSLLVIGQMRLAGNDSWHTVGLAAFLILMCSPSALFDIGFQLSFSAVLGILLFYPPLQAMGLPRRGWQTWLCRLGYVSMAAQMGVSPLLLFYFHRLSLTGLFLGPFYVLMATFILYVALLFLALAAVGGGVLLRLLLEGLVEAQHGLMGLAIRVPQGAVEGVCLSWGQVLLCYAALLCLLPSLYALRQPDLPLKGYRRAMFFRTWPSLLAAIVLMLSVVLL